MEWNDKVEIIRLANQGNTEMFYQHVRNHVGEFDRQAWHIFINGFEFDKSTKAEEFIREIFPFWKKVEDDMLPFMGFRECMRWSLFEMIAEGDMSLIENTYS